MEQERRHGGAEDWESTSQLAKQSWLCKEGGDSSEAAMVKEESVLFMNVLDADRCHNQRLTKIKKSGL